MKNLSCHRTQTCLSMMIRLKHLSTKRSAPLQSTSTIHLKVYKSSQTPSTMQRTIMNSSTYASRKRTQMMYRRQTLRKLLMMVKPQQMELGLIKSKMILGSSKRRSSSLDSHLRYVKDESDERRMACSAPTESWFSKTVSSLRASPRKRSVHW